MRRGFVCLIVAAAATAMAPQARAEAMQPRQFLAMLDALEARVAQIDALDRRGVTRLGADLLRHIDTAAEVAWVGDEERRDDARRICGLAGANLHWVFGLRRLGDPEQARALPLYQKSKTVCARKAGVAP